MSLGLCAFSFSCLAERRGRDKGRSALRKRHAQFPGTALTQKGWPCDKGANDREPGERRPGEKVSHKIINHTRHKIRPECEGGQSFRRVLGLLLALVGFAALATPVSANEKPIKVLKASLSATETAPDKPKTTPGTDSGLPVPRFVSLKSSRINVRRGPGSDNQIVWVFKRKGLPVEVTAESGRWRRIRDREGDVGWVWHSMLDGRRSAIVTGQKGEKTPVPLFTEPSQKSAIVAYAEIGVIARMPFCQDRWCELEANGYEGWVLRDNIWGTYANENFE